MNNNPKIPFHLLIHNKFFLCQGTYSCLKEDCEQLKKLKLKC